MFNTKHNPNLKNTKFESTEAAIKRGVIIQTSFLSKREIKAKLKADVELNPSEKGQSCYDADTYHQLKLLGMLGS